MKPFRAFVDLDKYLPDDRLYTITSTDGKITNHFREGHLAEGARRDMEEYMRHITRSGWFQDDRGRPHMEQGDLSQQDEVPDEAGKLEIHMERVSEHVLYLATCSFKIRRESHGTVFLWLVRQDLVTPEVVKEFDEEVARFDPQYERWDKRPSGFIVPKESM